MNIDDIKKRCEAATEGPWNIWDGPAYAGGGEDLCIGSGAEWVVNMDHRIAGNHDRFHDVDLCDICSGITEEQRFNAEFIAHARTDIPDLIAEVEWLKERMQAVSDTAGHNIKHGCAEKWTGQLKYLKCLADMSLKEPRDET